MDTVYISKMEMLEKNLNHALKSIGGVGSVLIKPNFAMGLPADTGATTSFNILKTIIVTLKENGIQRIAIGEAAGVDTENMFKALKVRETFSEMGIEILNFEKCDRQNVKINFAYSMKQFSIPAPVYDYDLIINVPKMKTHEQTTVSLGMKNFFAFFSYAERRAAHLTDLEGSIADMCFYLMCTKPIISVIDGSVAMDGPKGPLHGRPLKLDAVIVGTNLISTDIAAVKWMGGNPDKIRHLSLLSCEEYLKHEDYFNHPTFDFPSRTSIRCAANMWKESVFYKRAEWKNFEKCTLCGVCAKVCPKNCIKISVEHGVVINKKQCVGCLCCTELCPTGAIVSKQRFGWIFERTVELRKIYHEILNKRSFKNFEHLKDGRYKAKSI
jgi:uncharacterized protein (DUF362 family)